FVPSPFGQLELTGTNTFSGVTILDGGLLQVDGVQTSSAITLNGGTLMGRGRVGPIQGGLGGSVSPGIPIATFQNYLRCLNVTFNSNSTFRPVIYSNDPDFENSRLIVTGTVALGSSTLAARRASFIYNPAPGTQFMIINNDGTDPISGTFNGLPEGATVAVDGLPFRISYVGGTGNDVVL